MKVSIIESKFRRSKLELTYTKLWKSLEVSKQNIILREVNLLKNESPILSLFLKNDDWWLITDQNIYNYNNFLEIINLKEILNIEISSHIKFLNENYLNIYYDNKKITLKLEQKSWVIIIEILKHLTHLNISVNKDFT